MAAKNYFSHTSPDEQTFSQRINATGYSATNLAENIAAGYATVAAVMAGWQSSDGHCRNLMNPAITEVGVACVPGGTSGSYSTYWTMDLARPN